MNRKIRRSSTDWQRKYYIFNQGTRFLMRECKRITGIREFYVFPHSRLHQYRDLRAQINKIKKSYES